MQNIVSQRSWDDNTTGQQDNNFCAVFQVLHFTGALVDYFIHWELMWTPFRREIFIMSLFDYSIDLDRFIDIICSLTKISFLV